MSLRHKVDSDIGGYYRVWSSVRVSPSSVSSRQDLCIDFFQVAVHLCFWSDDNELSQAKKRKILIVLLMHVVKKLSLC